MTHQKLPLALACLLLSACGPDPQSGAEDGGEAGSGESTTGGEETGDTDSESTGGTDETETGDPDTDTDTGDPDTDPDTDTGGDMCPHEDIDMMGLSVLALDQDGGGLRLQFANHDAGTCENPTASPPDCPELYWRVRLDVPAEYVEPGMVPADVIEGFGSAKGPNGNDPNDCWGTGGSYLGDETTLTFDSFCDDTIAGSVENLLPDLGEELISTDFVAERCP